MRFRFSRSLIFWLGLPGLIFLLWAWWDSYHWRSEIGFRTYTLRRGDLAWHVHDSAIHFRGALQIGWTGPEVADGRMTVTNGPHFDRLPMSSSAEGIPTPGLHPERLTFQEKAVTRQVLTLPHWLILLLYLGVWMVAIAWRWKRATSTLEYPASFLAKEEA